QVGVGLAQRRQPALGGRLDRVADGRLGRGGGRRRGGRGRLRPGRHRGRRRRRRVLVSPPVERATTGGGDDQDDDHDSRRLIHGGPRGGTGQNGGSEERIEASDWPSTDPPSTRAIFTRLASFVGDLSGGPPRRCRDLVGGWTL